MGRRMPRQLVLGALLLGLLVLLAFLAYDVQDVPRDPLHLHLD